MEKFKNWEKHGLKDLFNSEAVADSAIPIAKIVSKNMLNPQTNSGAALIILFHNNCIHSLRFVSNLFHSISFRGAGCNSAAFNQYTKHTQPQGHNQREFIQVFTW